MDAHFHHKKDDSLVILFNKEKYLFVDEAKDLR